MTVVFCSILFFLPLFIFDISRCTYLFIFVQDDTDRTSSVLHDNLYWTGKIIQFPCFSQSPSSGNL